MSGGDRIGNLPVLPLTAAKWTFLWICGPFPQTSPDPLLRTSALHTRAQRAKFAPWLDTPDPCTRANCLMVLILRVMTPLHRQLTRLASDFARTGGLREQMSATRRAARAFHAPQR